MAGVGVQELVIVLIVGAFFVAVPIAILVLLVLLLRRQGQAAPTDSELVRENKRLRAEIASLKAKN